MNTKKYIGVKNRHGDGNFEARAVIQRRVIHVGTFKAAKDAALARDLFVLNNSTSKSDVSLNFPAIRDKWRSIEYPESIGTITTKVGERPPRAATGHKYIHREGDSFILRASVKVKKRREYIRGKYTTLAAALAARHKTLGIPIPLRA